MLKNENSIIEKKIKKALIDADVKQVDIARKLRISYQYVHVVIKGRRRTARVRMAIAKAAGRPVEELWPDHKANPKKKAA